MKNLDYFEDYFSELHARLESVDKGQLMEVAKKCQRVADANSKIVIVGNGGSAAIASHVSVDFTKAAGIRAINFNESDLITCFANDYGYENWVSEALKAYAASDDLVMLMSSSGSSPNIVNAGHYCVEQNIELVTFSGFSSENKLRQLGDVNFHVASHAYNIVEMTHHIWILAILDYLLETPLNKEN